MRMFTTDLRRWVALTALKGWDVLCFLAVTLIALALEGVELESLLTPPAWRFGAWLAASLVLWHLCLRGSILYRSRRLSPIAVELWDILKAVSFGTALVGLLALQLNARPLTPNAIRHIWLLSLVATAGTRLVLRLVLGRLRLHGRNLRSVLVAGSGEPAEELLRRLCTQKQLGYSVIGYVDDREEVAGGNGAAAPTSIHDQPRLGSVEDLGEILARNVIDEVLVAFPPQSFYESTARVIRQCEEQGVPLRLRADLFTVRQARFHFDVLDGVPMLSLAPHEIRGWQVLIKRFVDVVVSGIALILLAPLFVIVGILIKLDSPGPVFFVQPRVGLNKRTFRLVKFRTMVADGESKLDEIAHLNEVDGPVFKIRDDPRVMRVGRWLRRKSIDELPQLFNVLVGDMSLVGPRPLPLRDVDGFRVHSHRRRFSVKPGITCLWQVNGRSTVGFDQWMEQDMQYIDEWSLALDLKILLKTVPVVMRGEGAY